MSSPRRYAIVKNNTVDSFLSILQLNEALRGLSG
jgi:hypothetical protein